LMKNYGTEYIVVSIGKVKMVRQVSQYGDQRIHQKFSLALLISHPSQQLAKPVD